MSSPVHHKVSTAHLERDAYLYVRQSTLRQVMENTESTKRQYALKSRAVALGWPIDRIEVIDCDLGQSAASEADREGFRQLVGEVSMGHVGIVLGLEVSRLARSCADWHRLLEICALTDTLILDEDGLYHPGDFNDRLLLGFKGTMSEAELHLLRARLQGGIRNKARRGELKIPLPIGLVYDPEGRVVLDPDQQVQHTIHAFFAAYERIGSACGVVRYFDEQDLPFPRRVRGGPHHGEVVWAPLTRGRTLGILHNPRYAGAFAFGRTRTHKTADGRTHCQELPRSEWQALILSAHPGYITWEQYEEHQRRLHESAHAYGLDRRKSPPREGPALLQGLAICGVCAQRMTIRYHSRRGSLKPTYLCQREALRHARKACQVIPGHGIDAAVGELLLERVQPEALEIAWAVQQEVQSRIDEADRLRHQQVERAHYEAKVAERRFMKVDPDHRLVADHLEADWNAKLRVLAEAQEEYERQRQADKALLDETTHSQVMALATDFPKLWADPLTSDRDRKRMVRFLIEDVTLVKAQHITAHVRFKGGATRTLKLPIPVSGGTARKPNPQILAEIDRLLDTHTDADVATQLNSNGYRSGTGREFTPQIVKRIRYQYRMKTRYHRLRDAGMLTATEIGEALGISTHTVKIRQRQGLLRAHPYNDKGQCLFEPPEQNLPAIAQSPKTPNTTPSSPHPSDRTYEVHCEA